MTGKRDLTADAFYAERIGNLSLMDDEFMSKIFEDEECTEHLIRTILGNSDLHVIKSRSQKRTKNLQGRDIVLDILAQDSQKKLYNIEVQRDSRGASLKRARYHGSIIDANALRKGQDFNDMPDRYVIFITERDVLGSAEQVNRLQLCSMTTNTFYDDGAYTVYVNASMTDDTPVGKLMQDMRQTDPGKIHNHVLAERVRYFKENEEGVRSMNTAWEKMRKEEREYGEKKGLAEGRTRRNNEIVKNMRAEGMTAELISKVTGLTVDEIKRLTK